MVASSKMAAHQRWIVFVVEDHNKASGLGEKTPNGAGLAEGHSRQAVFRSTPPAGPGGWCIIHKKCTHVSQHTYTLNLKNLIL